MNELYEWNEPVNLWGAGQIRDYVVWVKEAYGMKEAKKLFKYAKQYRAIKDLQASVREETNLSVTEMLARSMMNTKEVMAANLINTVFSEEYEKHGKALLNEHNNNRL